MPQGEAPLSANNERRRRRTAGRNGYFRTIYPTTIEMPGSLLTSRPLAFLASAQDVENNKGRINYQTPWEAGLAVGSGSVEGACKHLIQSRFKRAGMRWKSPGFLNVVELRVARLNGTDREFWANRGLLAKVAA